jgi:hypothetical protein
MMPGTAEQPTPRVAVCESCGASTPAGRRGPLPRRCAACGADRNVELGHRIATARNTALRYDRPDIAARLDEIGALVIQGWTRLGE